MPWAKDLTIEEAEALAEETEARHQGMWKDYQEQLKLSARFRGASATEVVRIMANPQGNVCCKFVSLHFARLPLFNAL